MQEGQLRWRLRKLGDSLRIACRQGPGAIGKPWEAGLTLREPLPGSADVKQVARDYLALDPKAA